MTIEPLKSRRANKQLSVSLTEEVRDRIKTCAEKANVSESDIVRLLINQGLEDLEVQLKVKRRRRNVK